MRWLHLTDLHIGRSHDQNQENALASLVRDIASLPDLGDVDCIFLTGDLAWSGQDAEYQRFERMVLYPLRELVGLRSARIFTVPGNHDLDCDRALPVAWDALGSQRQSTFFSSTAQILREPRTRAFEAYSKFVARNGIDGVDPVRDVFAAYEVESTCGTVQIVTLNTSLLSDKCWSDEQKLPAPTPALREALDKPGEYHLRFVLGHHPVRWFAFADQEPLKSLLAERQAIYLHGHIHDIELVEVQQRPLGFGFGAVYQASLDQPQPSNYQNMYALCELDGDGIHVMVRSWDNKYGKWIPHHRLPASFRNRSAKFPDGHVLPLGHLPPLRPKGRPNPTTAPQNEQASQTTNAPTFSGPGSMVGSVSSKSGSAVGNISHHGHGPIVTAQVANFFNSPPPTTPVAQQDQEKQPQQPAAPQTFSLGALTEKIYAKLLDFGYHSCIVSLDERAKQINVNVVSIAHSPAELQNEILSFAGEIPVGKPEDTTLLSLTLLRSDVGTDRVEIDLSKSEITWNVKMHVADLLDRRAERLDDRSLWDKLSFYEPQNVPVLERPILKAAKLPFRGGVRKP